jgi:hypothetical protein
MESCFAEMTRHLGAGLFATQEPKPGIRFRRNGEGERKNIIPVPTCRERESSETM